MKILSFNKILGLVLAFASIALIATSSSCSEFQPNWDVADYGYSLPNYCYNNKISLQVLDAETREYGQLLAERGYLGGWDGILYPILLHHFIWGDYEAALKAGRRYSEIRGAARIAEYDVARFLVEDSVLDAHQNDSPFYGAFALNAQDIRNSSYH